MNIVIDIGPYLLNVFAGAGALVFLAIVVWVFIK